MAEQTHGQAVKNSALQDALATLIQEITELAPKRPHLAAAVHTIAGHLFELTAAGVGETASSEASASQAEESSVTFPVEEAATEPVAARPQISVGTTENTKPRYSDVTDDDLSLMVERCRLKAEGTLWALEREERLRDGADFHEEIRPSDQEIIQRAKQLPNCFLWMNQPRDDIWKKAGDFDVIADCFDALAESLASLDTSLDTGTPEQFLQAVNLTAEAQSALRTAVNRVDNYPDSDQQMAYHWLRNRASQDRFYIARYLKISDPADPHRAEAMMAEAQELQKSLAETPPAEPPQEQRDVA